MSWTTSPSRAPRGKGHAAAASLTPWRLAMPFAIASPQGFPQRAVPRSPTRQPCASSASPILSCLSRPRIAAPRLAARWGSHQRCARRATAGGGGSAGDEAKCPVCCLFSQRLSKRQKSLYDSRAFDNHDCRFTGKMRAFMAMTSDLSQRRLLKVFIASPGDLQPERQSSRAVVDEINRTSGREAEVYIDLLGWEDALPGVGRPQTLINQDVDRCENRWAPGRIRRALYRTGVCKS
jgi:hypothetical protein